MTPRAKTKGKNQNTVLSNDLLLEAYRNMIASRAIDEKMLIMLKQSKGFFHIGVSGHECAQTAAAMALEPGKDWALPYYRGLALTRGLGMTDEDIMLQFMARAADPASGGRQLPNHFGSVRLRIPTQGSATGSQYLHAVGIAHGILREGSAEVVVVTSGEGATSEGDYHEALSWASCNKLPVIFLIEDNGFSISVPRSEEVPGESVFDMSAGYADVERFQVDGTDFQKSYAALSEAVRRARAGEGASVVVADVVRLLSHSNSDDQRKYRTAESIAEDQTRDPIPKLRALLIDNGALTDEQAEAMDKEIRSAIDTAAEAAEAQAEPDRLTATDSVYSSEASPCFAETTPAGVGDPIVMVDAINHALDEEMARNDKMLIFGQDVGHGKGGVFTATKNLAEKYGVDRVFNAPIAESAIIGVAIGLALKGFRPVVEIQFADYMWTAMNQIRNELAVIRYRSNNSFECPVVIRIPCGGYIHGALYHSQSVEATLAHIPGLRVVMPSNAADAKGLLKTAIQCKDPVVFLEPKALYRQGFARSPEPDADWRLPFGKARIVREGSDVTIVTYGNMVNRAVEAATQLQNDAGIHTEVVDLRSISPWDKETVLASIAKTSRVVVAYEANRTAGFGAEIAAIIADEAFHHLDAPVRRVAAEDAPCPYNGTLEAEILPQVADLIATVREITQY